MLLKYFKRWKKYNDDMNLFLYKILLCFDFFDNDFLTILNLDKSIKTLKLICFIYNLKIKKQLNTSIEILDYRNFLIFIKNNIIFNNYTKIYLLEINNYLEKKSAICICNQTLHLINKNRCYNNDYITCDYDDTFINDDILLHCRKNKSKNHLAGFDIKLDNVYKYQNEYLNRRLETKIYNEIDKLNNIILYQLIDNDEDIINIIEKFNSLKKKYISICNILKNNTIKYYLALKNDLYFMNNLENTDNNILKKRLKIYFRILYNNKWNDIINRNLFHLELNSINYKKFIKTLKPYPYMFKNNILKTKLINNCKKINKNILKIITKLFDKTYDIIIVFKDLENISFMHHLYNIKKLVDDLILDFYEAINLLEKTPLKNEYLKIKEISIKNMNNYKCLICLDSKSEDDYTKIVKCDHIYHKKCLINWLTISNTCPLCR